MGRALKYIRLKKEVSVICCAILLTSSFARPALASDDSADQPPVRKLHVVPRVSLVLFGLSTVGWTVMEYFQNDIARTKCFWCHPNAFDRWGYDNLRWSDDKAAEIASHSTAYLITPALVLGLDSLAAKASGRSDAFVDDVLVMMETVAVSSFVSQVVKCAVGRQRPDVYYGETKRAGASGNTSFYSGHVNFAYTLAVAGGTIAWMRGYEMAPWIWGTGLTVATATAYFRVASARHYLTDVIAGGVVGSAFGFGIPYLFHRPKGTNLFGKFVLFPEVLAGGGAIMAAGYF